MSLPAPEKDIFPLEITNISPHGFWLLYGGKKLFLPFDEFPWLRDKPAKSISYVVELTPDHFYWPDMDVKWVPLFGQLPLFAFSV